MKQEKQGHFTPPMVVSEEDFVFAPTAYDESRERSHTPPTFTYASYPPPEELVFAHSYSSPPQPAPMTAIEPYPAFYVNPVTLPPMNHFNDAVTKREYAPPDDGMGFMSYGYIHGVEMTPPTSYDNSDPHVSHLRQRR